MLAVITGDIINSRKLANTRQWLGPIEKLFGNWAKVSEQWQVFRGDSFQLEVEDPEDALRKAMVIKAVLKSVRESAGSGRTGPVDVRMAIGIGERSEQTGAIGTKTGSAYYHTGEAFEMLRPKKQHLLIRSPWQEFDREMNLMFKFALIVMDNWSVNSGELMQLVLEHPDWKQLEIGAYLGIEQNSVSGRFKRAYHAELIELDEIYRLKLKRYCDVGFDKIDTGPPAG